MLKKQAPQHTTAPEARSRMAETGRNHTLLQALALLACLLASVFTVRVTRADFCPPTTTQRKECNP